MRNVTFFTILVFILTMSCIKTSTAPKSTTINSSSTPENEEDQVFEQNAVKNNNVSESNTPQPTSFGNYMSDAPISLKLVNSASNLSDSNLKAIFEDEQSEANFAQEIIQNSNLLSNFSKVMPYNIMTGYYIIEIDVLRVLRPITLNRVFHDKSYILNFRLFFQIPNEKNPELSQVFLISQFPLKMLYEGDIKSVYIKGLNSFIDTTRKNKYYKSEYEILKSVSEKNK